MKDKKSQILYVGKAINLKERVRSYLQNKKNLGPKTLNLVNSIHKISHINVQSELEALLLEANLIKKYSPKYNVDLKDGKAYPLIKITAGEDYPRILTARKIENDGSKYFGPYPDTKTMRLILKLLRRMFPYCSCRKHPRSCLYHDLNLCPLPEHNIDKKEYRRTVQRIESFLEGKKSKIIKDLEEEMDKEAQSLNFEEASKIKIQIEKIVRLTAPRISPHVYLSNPNFLEDRRNKELGELQNVLKLTKVPNRIECYDISNLMGQNATGSMVVFQGGVEDKGEYRRFRIKTKKTPDDIAMLKEVFTRRLKHKQWDFPDLIIVDGGKAQLNALKEVLEKYGQKIDNIAIAKRLEEIYYEVNGKITKIELGKGTPALMLLMRIRDEAHRFAKKYHELLRSKKLLSSLVDHKRESVLN